MGRRRSLWPARRRRRASSGDAAIGIVVIAAIAIAALGVYLLIIGAVALIGWLAAVAAKHHKSSASTFVSDSTPSVAPPPPPEHQYHIVLPVDPAVFGDATLIESTTAEVFRAWARQLPKAPTDPRDTLRRTTVRTRLIGRLTTKLDGRRYAWRSAPYRGRDRMAGVPMDPANLDPYNPPHDLRVRSGYLSLCRGCGGDGRLVCTACGGSARTICVDCAGAGKVHGVTANGARRLLNCKSCKGKASRACGGCSKGQIDCSSCALTGRVDHWLEVEGGPRDGDVQVEPDGDVTRAFVWGKDGVQSSHEEIVKDAKVVCAVNQDRLLTLEDLPVEVPSEWRSAYWQGIQARIQPGERIVSQTFTLLEVPAVEVTYAVGSESQMISFEGLRMLAPPVTSDRLFSGRASALQLFAWVLGAVPLAVLVVYLARGQYFLKPAMAGVVVCAAAAGAVIYGVLWRTTLRRVAWTWLGAAVVPMIAGTVLAIVIEPSVGAARGYVDAGQLDLARVELGALGDGDASVAIWMDIYAKDALAAKTCSEVTAVIGKMSVRTPQRVVAQAHADALAVTAAETSVEAGQLDGAASALACASDALRNGPTGSGLRSRIELAAAKVCLMKKDWDCVLAKTKTAGGNGGDALRAAVLTAVRADVDTAINSARVDKDPRSRLLTGKTAIDLWTRYLITELGNDPAQLVALKATTAKDEQTVAKLDEEARLRQVADEKRREAEAKRLAVIETRRLEAEARAAKRRAAEEERKANQPTGLLCNDGTLSPSCSCGGSHQGCCSRHGGVAGCQ